MASLLLSGTEVAMSVAFNALVSSHDGLKYASRKNVESEINQWSKLLHEMNCVLDDAEERQMSDVPMKLWLDNLRDLAYDVEDILDEFSTEVLRQKFMEETEASMSKVLNDISHTSFDFSPRDIKFNMSLGSKMKEITQRYETIIRERENLRWTEKTVVETTNSVRESKAYGRENDKKTLINELLNIDNGKPYSVVAIVGMGGLGKTTLAQLVHDDETVRRSFDIMAWVCVSDELDVFKITVKIIEGLTSSPCDMMELNDVQNKLKDVLHRKKFLLILDDLWNDDYLKWHALSRPLAAGGFGSKVLITTRNENVADKVGAGFVHHLKKLKFEECLSLLALHAFGDDTLSCHQRIQEAGEQIAKKCDGLPLAIKAIGGLLRERFDPREWERVLSSDAWELPQEKSQVLPALRLVYYNLPSHLKRCVAYCAIFPTYFEFEKDDMILWWMAEGLLEKSKLVLSNFTKVGNEYFEALLTVSFFQLATSSSKGSKFVVHGLMNDLATWVNGGTCLQLNTHGESNRDEKFANPRHLLLKSQFHEFAKRFEKFPKSTGLRTLIALDQCIGSSNLDCLILERVIPKMKGLKLLCLSRQNIRELPDSISDLKQLRHLDMSFTKIQLLPNSTCDLFNLQVLKLLGCKSLILLPRQIRKLINLRVLDIRETDQLCAMPPGIGCLKNLQILSKFIVGEKRGLILKELKELPVLRGELSILGMERVVDVQEASDANLKAKEGLISLEFKWMEETTVVVKEKQLQILDELEPHTALQSLEISGYNGEQFPKWVGDCRFNNLEKLSLCDCKSVSLLPPVGGLMLLKSLEIIGMIEVKKVGKEFLGNTSNSNTTFPCLETLILQSMNGLEEWCSCFGNVEETGIVFPRLQKMEIRDCPMLVGKLPNHLQLLQELSIRRCPNLLSLKCRHPSLRTLFIEHCSEATLKTLGDLNSLKSLKLKNIEQLICMDDELLRKFGALQELEIESCGELKSLVRNEEEIERMVGLQRLTIRHCDELVSFGPMRLPSSLKQMSIYSCSALKLLPEGFMVDGSGTCEYALEKLTIWSCPALTTFPRGRFSDLLIDLSIEECENLQIMPEFSNSIKNLTVIGCDNLESMPRVPVSVVRWRTEKSRLRPTSNHGDLSRGSPVSVHHC